MLANDAKVFLTLWVTAALLLLWLGDYNIYLHFPDGTSMLKQRAHLPDRLIWSSVFGLAYAIGCTWIMRRWIRPEVVAEKSGNTQEASKSPSQPSSSSLRSEAIEGQ
jgi:hypothetical protein